MYQGMRPMKGMDKEKMYRSYIAIQNNVKVGLLFEA